MEESTEKPVDINSLSPDKQRKVRRIRACLRNDSYVVAGKDVDNKTVERLLDDIEE